MEEYKIYEDYFRKYTGKAEEFSAPNGVKEIGMSAFSGRMRFKSVIFPPSIRTIRSYAFKGCTALARVVLPKKLEHIQDNAFSGCISLAIVCYSGTPDGWNDMVISEGNTCLTEAAHYYYSAGENYDG